jgi:hypothetical protein
VPARGKNASRGGPRVAPGRRSNPAKEGPELLLGRHPVVEAIGGEPNADRTGWLPMSAAMSPYVVHDPAGSWARALFMTSHGTVNSLAGATAVGPGQIEMIRSASAAARAWISGRAQCCSAAISWFMEKPLFTSCSGFTANELLLSFAL